MKTNIFSEFRSRRVKSFKNMRSHFRFLAGLYICTYMMKDSFPVVPCEFCWIFRGVQTKHNTRPDMFSFNRGKRCKEVLVFILRNINREEIIMSSQGKNRVALLRLISLTTFIFVSAFSVNNSSQCVCTQHFGIYPCFHKDSQIYRCHNALLIVFLTMAFNMMGSIRSYVNSVSTAQLWTSPFQNLQVHICLTTLVSCLRVPGVSCHVS